MSCEHAASSNATVTPSVFDTLVHDQNEATQITDDLTLDELQIFGDAPPGEPLLTPQTSRVEFLDEPFPSQDTPHPASKEGKY